MTPEQEAAVAAAKARLAQKKAAAPQAAAQFNDQQRAAIEAAMARLAATPAEQRRAAMLENIAKAKAGDLRVSPESAGRHAYASAMSETAMNDGAFGAFMGNMAKGVTFGFQDEIAAGLGSMLEDRSYDEILSGLRDRDRQIAKVEYLGSLIL